MNYYTLYPGRSLNYTVIGPFMLVRSSINLALPVSFSISISVFPENEWWIEWRVVYVYGCVDAWDAFNPTMSPGYNRD